MTRLDFQMDIQPSGNIAGSDRAAHFLGQAAGNREPDTAFRFSGSLHGIKTVKKLAGSQLIQLRGIIGKNHFSIGCECNFKVAAAVLERIAYNIGKNSG